MSDGRVVIQHITHQKQAIQRGLNFAYHGLTYSAESASNLVVNAGAADMSVSSSQSQVDALSAPVPVVAGVRSGEFPAGLSWTVCSRCGCAYCGY